jgi:hypothetical protein
MQGMTEVIQNAWVVNDLDAAMRRWIQVQGVGPFYVMRHCAVTNTMYRGRPVNVDFDVGIAQAGGVQIELIQQHNDAPSAYRDVYAPGQEGFHHTCVIVPDLEATLAHYAKHDAPVSIRGDFGAVHWAYVDTRPHFGTMTEVVGEHPDIRAFFKLVADGAVGWNGKDPIRNL